MRYKVIKKFRDLQDGAHVYNVGDIYPREGITASDERIAELSSADNKAKMVLIKEVKARKKKKNVDEV